MTYYKIANPHLGPLQIQEAVRRLEADLFKHALSEVCPLSTPTQISKITVVNYL